MYGMQRPKKDGQSELIEGQGTGTSDSIKKNVPAGSFIMPADSTQKIGPKNLKKLGSPQPVNLSNGEFQIPPEQVHQVGVQALEQMKDATHTPVPDQQGFGFKPGATMMQAQPQSEPPKLGFNAAALRNYQDNIKIGESGKPELFFASGGVVPHVDDDLSKSFTADVLRNSRDNAANSFSQGNYARGVGEAVRGVVGSVPAAAYDVSKSAYNTFGRPVANAIDGFLGMGENQQTAIAKPDPTKLATNVRPAAAKPDPAKTSNAATSATQPNAMTGVTPEKAATAVSSDLSQQNTKQPTSMFGDTQQPTAQQNTPNPYAIQTKGNSFSYADPQAAAAARAADVPELQSSGIQTGLGIRGVKDFMANTREMGASDQQIKAALARREMNLGLQGFGGIARQPQVQERTPEQEAQLQAEIKRVSAPIAGARGLTASQRNQINDLQQGYSNRENDVYKTDANNAAAMQREAMGQAGQNYRAELGEQGANDRFNSNLNFDVQKFNATNDLANRQFSAEQLSKMPERMKQQAEVNLLQQYDAAQTDEERKPILERLSMLRGQGQQQSGNPYMAIKQGEVVDAKGVVTQPSKEYLYNTKTGQTVDPLANMQSQQKSISRAEYDALPKGSQYIGEDGKSYIKG